MENELKLPEDLILEIQNLKEVLMDNIIKVGRLSVQKSFYEKDLSAINNELESLHNEASDIYAREEALQEKVVGKYGKGKLDFETGLFTKDM
jgi:hypothetical protein